MNKVKLYGLFSIVLLAINIVLLWMMFSRGAPSRREEEPKKFIIEKLHFDENQIRDYEKLIKGHRENITATDDKIKLLKEELYSCLKDDNTPKADSLMQELSKEKLHIEQIHYQHFNDIKKLCKPDQLANFNSLTTELAKLFAPHPRRNEKR
jgi:regulatory protein YycI of two-component signal transduction system YycFG